MKLTTSFATLVLLIFMQSCTVPNPYEPINNETNASTGTNDDSNNNNNNTGTNTGGNTGNTGGTSSTSGKSESHNAGQNCMNCHNPGGEGDGIWQIAGTVYNQTLAATNPNATVKLYTGPNGTGVLKYILNVDTKGNFYTSGNIDFTAAGLYPAVSGSTTTNYMSTPIAMGACNSCHNSITTARIWTN